MPTGAASGGGAEASRRSGDEVEVTDTTPEFEEYTSAPRVDEHGKPIPKAKGLRASGYQFPPPLADGAQPPLTKANLAKGIGVPGLARPAPHPEQWPVPPLPGQAGQAVPDRGRKEAAHAPQAVPDTLVRQLEPVRKERPAHPPAVKVDEGELFEEYRRPGLDRHPATGKGIRTDPPPPPSAKELLSNWEPPEPEVLTPRRFGVMPAAPRKRAGAGEAAEEDAAELDAASDLASAPADAVMSKPVANGPVRTIIHHDDDDREEPVAPPAAAQAAGAPAAPASPSMPATTLQPASPHLSGAPTPAAHGADGPVPRIGIVHCLFHQEITDAMVAAAEEEARRLGAPVIARIDVAGVFDAPLAAKRLLGRPDVDAVVVVGCVLQGETGHDELIAHAAAQTLLALACNLDKPVGLGITGPRMTEAQARARVSAAAFAVSSAVHQHRVLKAA